MNGRLVAVIQKNPNVLVGLGFILLFVHSCFFAPKNLGGNGQREIRSIENEFSEVIFPPKTMVEIPDKRAKIENAIITTIFSSWLSNEEVHGHFLNTLQSAGWIYSRHYTNSLSSKTSDVYCKGRHKITIEYRNAKTASNRNEYGFSISWSLYEDEDCLGNPA